MQRHPLNTDFRWQQPPPPYELITDAQARAYREVGAFVLPEVFAASELAALTAALDPYEVAANDALLQVDADQPSIARRDEIVFRAHIVSDCEAARAFARHPVLTALCRDLIGPRVRLYWDQLVYKRPGTAAEFPWHQDNGYTFITPQQYLTCWVALTDADETNGCPWIAPGMHRFGTLAHRWTELGFQCLPGAPANAVPLPVKAGSVAVFSSLTPHRTGPNLTAAVRKSYILQYAPDGAVAHARTGPMQRADDPRRQFLVVGDD